MSGIKEVRFQMELDHKTWHREDYDPMCTFCVEEREAKQMAVYDHISSDVPAEEAEDYE